MATPLEEYMRKYHLGKGWSGMVSKETGKVCDPTYRDIGHCAPLILREAINAASAVDPSNAEFQLALDTISNTMQKIWCDSIEDNLAGLSQFPELYHAVRCIPYGAEAYAAFSAFFVQSFFCYMFTAKKMANGLTPSFGEPTQDFMAVLQVLSSLSDGTRQAAMKEFRDAGLWPTTVDSSKLLRRHEDFMAVVKEDQAIRLKQAEERDELAIKCEKTADTEV